MDWTICQCITGAGWDKLDYGHLQLVCHDLRELAASAVMMLSQNYQNAAALQK